jgi:hypothetical protein
MHEGCPRVPLSSRSFDFNSVATYSYVRDRCNRYLTDSSGLGSTQRESSKRGHAFSKSKVARLKSDLLPTSLPNAQVFRF